MPLDDETLDQLLRAGERELRQVPDIHTLRELVAAYHLQAAALQRFEAKAKAKPTSNRADLLK